MSNTRLGLIRCEHCGRQFNPHSGARHIPWCAKQQNEQRKHRLTTEMKQALERYRWRINYRPSNKLQQKGNTEQDKFNTNKVVHRNIQQEAEKRIVKSSISLSSPSAGSITSIGTNHSNSNSNDTYQSRLNKNKSINNKKVTGQQTQQQITKPTLAQLKRSLSSLTLVKQKGINSNSPNLPNHKVNYKYDNNYKRNQSEYSSSYQNKFALMRQRAKSHNDLLGMSEIVETLAKRMDEIYEQNQILLANIAQKKKKLNENGFGYESDENVVTDDNDNQEVDNNADNYAKCHHCKSSCLKGANYCHKCGCKLSLSSTPPPTTTTTTRSSSPSTT